MLGITLELMTKKRVTATELANRFEVSIRTIYRDIELINQAGIPIVSYTGTDGGFELMSGFFLTRQHFSVEDLSVIYSLLKGMGGSLENKSTSIMNKLSSLQPALINGKTHDKLIFDISTSDTEKQFLHLISDAIHQTKLISFTYTSSSGTITHRRVEPMTLYWERGIWYLQAYCLSSRALRFFRVSRMMHLDISNDLFQPRTLPPAQEKGETLGTKVHLRFDIHAQPRVGDQFPGEWEQIEDKIEVHTVFYKREYAISVILSYGTKVEIISPEDLKIDVFKQLKEIIKKYE
jgi:predicted DNA-binding transcriptional regulator YafY